MQCQFRGKIIVLQWAALFTLMLLAGNIRSLDILPGISQKSASGIFASNDLGICPKISRGNFRSICSSGFFGSMRAI